MKYIKVLIVLAVFLPIAAFGGTPEDYFVCELDTDCNAGAGENWGTGSDAYDCTSKALPCATINGAVDKIQAMASGDRPGSTITVGDGTYSENGNNIEYLTGTSENVILIQAENKYGAIVEGPQNDNSICDGYSAGKTFNTVNNNFYYVTFKNFYFKYGNYVFHFNAWDSGQNIHHVTIQDCKFEQQGNYWGDCYQNGCGASIFTGIYAHDITIERCIFSKIGNDTGSLTIEGCECTHSACPVHEHALYVKGWHILIQNNIFHTLRTGWAIKADDGPTSCTVGSCWSHKIINNTFNGEDVESFSTRSGDIVFSDTGDSGTHMPHDVVIANNAFYRPNDAASHDTAIHIGVVDYSGSDCETQYGDLHYASSVVVNNVTNSQYLFYACDDDIGTYSNNTELNNRSSTLGMTDPANFDFTPTSGAEYLLDTGNATYAPADDFNGTTRPLGPGDDIGAYEYQSTSFTVCSSGGDYTQNTFEALSGDKSGYTYYFCAETFTSQLDVNISGTSGNPVIIDGYQTDDIEYANVSEASGRAVINPGASEHGINLGGNDYITIQDFEITDWGGSYNGIYSSGSNDIILKRNYLHTSVGGGIFFTGGSYNITIGGSSGNGNALKSIGTTTADEDIALCGVHDVIVSYNHLYSSSSDYGIDGILMTCSSPTSTYDVLIAYNSIHDHDRNASGDDGEDGLDFKDGAYNIVVRYNHIYSHNNGLTSHGYGINMTEATDNVYIYGNKISANRGACLTAASGSDNIYFFSNICEDTYYYSGIWHNSTSTNWKIFNNTFAENATNPPSGTYSHIYEAGNQTVDIKNNIFYKGRPNDTVTAPYRQWYVGTSGDEVTTANYNHYYWPSETSEIFWGDDGSNTLSGLQTMGSPYGNQELNGSEGDPGLTDIANGDYRISSSNSSVYAAGTDMGDGNIVSLTIVGQTIDVPWDFALGPDTDWSGTIPIIDTINRDQLQWSQGAYEYAVAVTLDLEITVGTGEVIVDKSLGGTLSIEIQ